MDDGKKSGLKLSLILSFCLALVWTLSTDSWYEIPSFFKIKSFVVRFGLILPGSALFVFPLRQLAGSLPGKLLAGLRKKLFPITAMLSVLLTLPLLAFLPKALQPTNELTLLYPRQPVSGYPTVEVRSFSQRDRPDIFFPREDGIAGLMSSRLNGEEVSLSRKINLFGDLMLIVPAGSDPLPNILWNGMMVHPQTAAVGAPNMNPAEPVLNSDHRVIQLHSIRNPFLEKPLPLQGVLLLLFFAWAIVFWMILSGIALYLVFTFRLLTGRGAAVETKTINAWRILSILTGAAVFFIPLVKFPLPDRVVWFLVSSIAIWLLNVDKARRLFANYGKSWVGAAGLAASGWFAMTIAGNALLISLRTTLLLPPPNALFFLVVWIWSVIPVLLFLLGLAWLQVKSAENKPDHPRWKIFILFFLIFTSIFGIYLFAYNPAISSMDSQGQWWQATGKTPVDDAHSPFHTLFIRLLIRWIPHPTLIAIVQILWLSVLASGFLFWLYQKGIPLRFLSVFALVLAVMPNNGLTLITIWKDVPFTISLLWLTMMLARLLREPEASIKRWWLIPGLAVCLVFVCQFRHNGLLPGVLTAFFLLFFSLLHKTIRPALSVALFVVAMLLINGPLYRSMNVIPMDSQQVVTSLAAVNDMLSVKKLGGQLPDEAEGALDALLGDPETVDFSWFQNDTTWRRTADWEAVSNAELLTAYLRTILRNPLNFMRALLLRLDNLWALFESPYGGFNDNVNWTDADLAGFPRQPNAIQPAVNHWLKLISGGPLYPFVWRGGIWLALVLSSLIFLLVNRRGMTFFIAIPFIGNTLSLVLATYPAARYSWHVTLIFGFLIFSFVFDANRAGKEEKGSGS